MICIIKHVFNKRARELITYGGLEVVHAVDELVDNLLVALSDSAANFVRLVILPAYALIVTGTPAVLARYVLGVSRPSFVLVAVLDYF